LINDWFSGESEFKRNLPTGRQAKEEIKIHSLLLGATSNQLQNKYNDYFKYTKSKLDP
jgi:hypothetical protein